MDTHDEIVVGNSTNDNIMNMEEIAKKIYNDRYHIVVRSVFHIINIILMHERYSILRTTIIMHARSSTSRSTVESLLEKVRISKYRHLSTIIR